MDLKTPPPSSLDAYAELERSNAELSEFAYVASHDLKEPLHKILAFADRLKPLVKEAPGPDYLERLTRSAERMARLIDQVLELARVTEPGRPLERVRLDDLLDEALADLEAQVEEACTTVRREPLPALRGDPEQLRRLMQNLVGNALKYRALERPLRLRVAPCEAPERFVRFCVEDNGLGVPSPLRGRLFLPFQRLHGTRKPGSGIGLAICRKIALRHGGDLSYEPGDPHGSRFVVTLPTPYGG